MPAKLAVRHDVLDVPPAHEQIVRDDPPVASPPQSLRAHVRRSLARGYVHQRVQSRLPFGGFRVIGVRAKRGMLPCGVRRIRACRMAPAAEQLDPPVRNASVIQRARQLGLIEVGPAPRTREGAHVRQRRDPMLAEQREKTLDRMRRMADREDRRGRVRLAIVRPLRQPASPASRRRSSRRADWRPPPAAPNPDGDTSWRRRARRPW